MNELNRDMQKKTLVITSLKEDRYIPLITEKNTEELLIMNSFDSVISQPYGCLIRNIILAVYLEEIEEIFIIVENTTKNQKVSEDELLKKMRRVGVSRETLNTIEFIKVIDKDPLSWLKGPASVDDVIKNNIELIQKHPLLPETLKVYGIKANPITGEFKVVC